MNRLWQVYMNSNVYPRMLERVALKDNRNLDLKVGALYKIEWWFMNYHISLKEITERRIGLCISTAKYTATFITKDEKVDTWSGDNITYERLDVSGQT